jgi:mannose-1-phosphate guanylyltransferase
MATAILLVGGFGTRLMPLTKNTPKPMLTVAGIPVTEHQLSMAKAAGITQIVLATFYLSELFTPYFGDGSKWGMQIKYAVEKTPLGTGGAIRNAAKLLDSSESNQSNQSIVILNGDVLSSHNLSEQIRQHEEHGADVTLHLTKVDDARAYGCVPTDANGRVTDFLEKMEKPVTNQINAGCYVFNPRVLNSIALDTVVSVEREVFPSLVASGAAVYGYVESAYWIDIGTPQALMKASSDITKRHGEFLIMPGSIVDTSARLTGGSSIAPNCHIAEGALIHSSIIESNCSIGTNAQISNSYISHGTAVADGAKIDGSFVTNKEIISIF